MAAALPVTKLAGLLVKTFAKPLSKRIKTDLSRFDSTKQLLVDIGQASNKVTSYMTIWASGYRVRKISPLEEEKALKTGAEFVGEAFVLAVSAGVVVYEYNRSAQSASRKAEEKQKRIRATQDKLQAKLNALDIRIKAVEDLVKQQQELEEKRTLLDRVVPIGGTDKPKYIEPPKEKLVPIEEDHNEEEEVDKTPPPAEQEGAKISRTLSSTYSEDKKQESSSWWKFW